MLGQQEFKSKQALIMNPIVIKKAPRLQKSQKNPPNHKELEDFLASVEYDYTLPLPSQFGQGEV